MAQPKTETLNEKHKAIDLDPKAIDRKIAEMRGSIMHATNYYSYLMRTHKVYYSGINRGYYASSGRYLADGNASVTTIVVAYLETMRR